ncbi:type I polyketide synthase [Dictyobacter formicarum]|uniref:Polyketide synthase n=1 Tax=Dictyobacter formicarum TaxID=2778368 RepID=A0ABQ3VDV8_9CHLR|nr:type I polyketide synthase [Dictyobacter formicarum]GHO83944.1 polyketide synthase [Dictyobacter formicarum]
MSVKEPVAIVGMGCRFPGAKNLSAFWQLLLDGTDAIKEIPAERFDVDAVYDPTPGSAGKLITRWGGFLEDIDQFDPYFFGISPREAARMDPQQRLLLEVAWEALEDAGIPAEKLVGSATGVFVGMSTNDYEDLAFQNKESIDLYMMTGCSRGVASGRISYILDLQGPSMTIDTACSSSLVAVHLACQSIWSGECTLALAGGTNLILGPEQGLGFSKMGLLAPDGRCKTFDARANGFVRSEGVGTVVLKPLSQALADRDPIYCVIRGSAVNNDGRTSGLLVTPGVKSQEDVMRKAYLDAGVAPEQVQYVEAHGTGTIVGDRVEVTAIGTVCGAKRPQDQPCLIGSVKTNIGHSEGAAGMAGLLKVALSLKHGLIPPNLHLQQPHPQLPLQELHLQIPQEITRWRKDGRPALAGVSSFGISATNAHMVLEQAPSNIQVSSSRGSQTEQPLAHLLTLSAQTSEALIALARVYQEHFGCRAGDAAINFSDICYTANCRRSQHSQRLAVVAHSTNEMLEQLAAFVQGEDRQGIVAGTAPSQTPKIAFVFPGQGSQWLGMGRELLQQEPIFRQTLEQCESLMRPFVDWSLLDILINVDDMELLNRIDIVQPALFSIELALAALWRSWGIQPDAVVGHSMGELAAAVVAGALSAQDAMQVICQRSLLLKRVAGKGCMAVVELSLPEAQKLLIGYEEQVSIATSNGPNTTVLAGDLASIEILMQKLQKQKIYCSLIRVDVASHSAHMDVLLPELRQALLNLQPQEASIAFYSTVTASPLDASMQLDAGYWAQNIRQPVLFYPTIKRLLEDDYHIFLEISPHPILMGAVKETLQSETRAGTALPSLRRAMPERATLLETLGHLYTRGVNIDFNQFYVETGQCIPVPTYPWQRERFWLTEHDTRPVPVTKRGHARTRPGSASGHPMLGPWMTSAARPGEYCWEFDLDCDTFAYLRDHRMQDNAILPATAYLELALAAAREIFGVGSYPLEHVVFKKALFLPEDSVQHMQLIIAPEMPGSASFQLFSLQDEQVSTQSQWELHAQGRLLLRQDAQHAAEILPMALEQMQRQSSHVIAGDAHYQQMSAVGLQYGPAFRGVERIWQADGQALCQIAVATDIASNIDKYQFHPALFDACLQTVLAALPPHILADEEAKGPIVPIQIEHMQLYQPIHTGLWSYACMSLEQPEQSNQFELCWEIFNQEGQRVLEARGVRLQRLGTETRPASQTDEAEITDWLYEIQWTEERADEEHSVGAAAARQREKGSWLILADRLGVAQQVAEFLHTSGDNVIFVYPGDTFQELIPFAHYQLNPARPAEFRQFLQTVCEANLSPCHGILHFWSLEAQSSGGVELATLAEAELLGCGSTLHLLQAIEQISWQQLPRLWLITNGVQAIDQGSPTISVAQSPLWGLGRTIVYEHPELRCARVDLGADIRPAEIQSLFQLIYNDAPEDQIALRGYQRYMARLSKVDPITLNTVPATRSFERGNPLLHNVQPCRIDIPTPGSLDNLCLTPTSRTKPGPGEVEIQVSAAGLNFKDVLFALGMLDYQHGAVHFGHECAGRITALGEGVEGLHVGDEVIAVSAPACFSRFVVKQASFVVPKPRHLSFEEAATTSIVFLTAYYALTYVGRLMKGERVLIHAASGGVGLAAVQIARQIGAEIFATAGSPEKREFLRSLGIQHVMDSRSLSFADEIMELTHGQGVDVVLNSLAGEALTRSFALLANHGRFLELGKKDIQHNSRLNLAPFEKNLSFSAIDISLLLRERPQLMMSMLREILLQFESRTFTPLPTRTFPLAETIDAFRWLAQARQIGKVAISFESVAAEKKTTTVSERSLFKASSTYLITGGLGGLGLTIVQWMVEQGARHIVLVGRSSPSESAQKILAELKRQDVDVVVAQADITDRQQVANVLNQVKVSMPPLRGILHAAAILKDGILLQTSIERLQEVMAPKMLGAWNLHSLTADLPLDFFVCFSSTASLIGLPGQGNYSAANAFLDALAHYRRAQGLAALSINWGAWSEVGLAAAQANRGARLAQRGIKNISPQQGLAALELLLWNDKAQVGAMPFDVAQWQQFYPSVSNSAMFARLLADREDTVEIVESAYAQKKLAVSALQAQTLDEREQLVQSYLREHIARILRIPIARLDSQRQLHTLGIDSLMAVELKNQIEADTEITVPVVLLLQGTSIRELANYLLTELASKAAYSEQWAASEEADMSDALTH